MTTTTNRAADDLAAAQEQLRRLEAEHAALPARRFEAAEAGDAAEVRRLRQREREIPLEAEAVRVRLLRGRIDALEAALRGAEAAVAPRYEVMVEAQERARAATEAATAAAHDWHDAIEAARDLRRELHAARRDLAELVAGVAA